MAIDLSALSLGQLVALERVLEAAVAFGTRAEAQGVAFEAALTLDGEFATVVFGWPCDAGLRIEVGSGAPLALPAPDRGDA